MMHACLLVGDILRLVFECVDTYAFDPSHCTDIREPRSLITLAGLARTCGAFNGPALDVLWRDIPSLYVLARYAMPADLIGSDRAVLHWRREPTPAEWDRFDGRMRRIRSIGRPLPLTHQRIGENEVDVDSVCTRILEHLKAAGVPLPLSNIIEFRCREDLETRAEGEGRIYTDLFVGSSLRSVQLPNPGIVLDEEGSLKWGQWVSAPSRGLTQLFIPASYSTVPSAVRERLLSEFLTLPHLRELAIPAGMLVRGHGGPLYFTNHPTLEHLTIHSWESPLPAARPGTALGLFTHLRVLTLSVDVVYVNWPLQFLQQHVPLSTLKTFTIVFTPCAKGSSRTTLNSILAFLSPSTLTSLSVFLPGAEHDERIRWRDAVQRGAPLALDDLSPLLRLRSLRELRVEYPGRPVPVANITLRDLAEGAPALEVLSLCSPEVRMGQTSIRKAWCPTLDILSVLAEHCPRLRVIRIPVRPVFVGDSSCGDQGLPAVREVGLWVAPWRGGRGEDSTNDSLQPGCGDKERGPEEHPAPSEVANFLWELFPCVESLRFVVGRPDPLHVEDDMWGWKAVLESMMGSLDEVRKDRVAWRVE